MLTIYRILTFLLLPMAALFAIFAMIFITAAFANPAMLVPMFLIICVVIYSFASANFILRGIDKQRFLGKSAKDWLKINAYISSFYAIMMIVQCAMLLYNPSQIAELTHTAMERGANDIVIPEATLLKYISIMMNLFLFHSIILFIHVGLTLGYMKSYKSLFEKEE